MATKLLYIDTETGVTTEIESFVLQDFIRGGANAPVMTNNSGQIPFNYIPPTPPQIDIITLTSSNILSKSCQLEMIPPNPNAVVVTPVGGIAQILNVDFRVQNNILSWNGLGLDNFLEEGDQLLVQY